MRMTHTCFWTALLALSLALPVRAQDSSSQSGPTAKPVPPVQAEGSDKSAGNSDANPVSAVATSSLENVSLSGAQRPSLEAGPRRSFLYPQFEVYSQTDTNATNSIGSGPTTITEMVSLFGGLTLHKVTPHSQLNLSYLGGRSFSTEADQFNSMTHTFGLMERWSRARWSGALTDQLAYLSESLLGGANSPDQGAAAGTTNLSPTFLSNLTAFTNQGTRLSNSAVFELDYQASSRSSYTFLGSYDFLHFFGPALVNSTTAQGQVGYNYQLSHRDTIAVLYRFAALRFHGNSQSVNDHSAQIAYGRQIRERLAFRLGAGPEISLIQDPKLGTGVHPSWTVDASLIYQLERTSLGLFYDHSVTSGSGLFFGSTTDQVSGSLDRQLSRMWSVSFNGGYARNTGLTSTSLPSTTGSTSSSLPSSNTTFDSMFGGVRVARVLGRNASFFVNYWARYQTSNSVGCTGPNCASSLTGQQVAVGFSWHPNPIPLE